MAATEEKEEEQEGKGEELSEETANEKVVGYKAASQHIPQDQDTRGHGGGGRVGKWQTNMGGRRGGVRWGGVTVEGREKKMQRRLRRKYHNNSFDI